MNTADEYLKVLEQEFIDYVNKCMYSACGIPFVLDDEWSDNTLIRRMKRE